VLSFSLVVEIGTPPTHHPQANVPPSPLVPGGEAHSLAREGVKESQFRRGDIHCGTLYIYVLCGSFFHSITNDLLPLQITMILSYHNVCERDVCGDGKSVVCE
jgi:hypothetical protein